MKKKQIYNAFLYLFETKDYKNINIQEDINKNKNKEFIRIIKEDNKIDITLEDIYKVIDINFIDAIIDSNK